MLKVKLSKGAKWGQTNMLSNKRWCPRRTIVGLDRVSIIPLDWSMDDTQTHAWKCRQACKRCKKAKKAKQAAQNKQGKHVNIARSGERACIKQTNATEVYPTSGRIQTIHKRDGCNHTSKWPQRPTNVNPWRPQSMAKPRSRQANMDIKHRSKQANIDMHKGNDPNPLI